MDGQIELEDYLKDFTAEYWGTNISAIGGCSKCACNTCLYWWSGRCPEGGCFDERRAREYPYDQAHPDEPPRKAWSSWDEPEEQAHWCRGAIFYPVKKCRNYVKYEGSRIEPCIRCNIQKFQDGYISCGLVDGYGCQRCMEWFEEQMEKEE